MMLCGNHPLRTVSGLGGGGNSSGGPSTNSFNKNSPSQHPSTWQKQTKAQRQAAARTAAAKSKSKLWGPSHSFDSSDEESLNNNGTGGGGYGKLGIAAPTLGGGDADAGTGVSSWLDSMLTKAWTEWGPSSAVTGSGSGATSRTATGATGAGNKRTRTGRSSQLGKPMEVVHEEAGEESTDPSTQDESNNDSNQQQQQQQQQQHPQGLLNQSIAGNSSSAGGLIATVDSRSGVMAHHPAMLNDTLSSSACRQNDLNTSRDSTSSSRNLYNTHNNMSSTTRENSVLLQRGSNNNNDNSNTKTASTIGADNNDGSINHKLRNCAGNVTNHSKVVEAKVEEWTDLFSNACGTSSPCSAHDLEEIFGRQRNKTRSSNSDANNGKGTTNKSSNNLGIAPLRLDLEDDDDGIVQNRTPMKSQQHQTFHRTLSEDSPAERRRQRNMIRRQRHEKAAAAAASSPMAPVPHEDFEVTSQQDVLITQPTTTALLQTQSQLLHQQSPPPPPPANGMGDENILSFPPPNTPPAPLETLLVREDEAQALERSISELTMRSSYQDHVQQHRPTGGLNSPGGNGVGGANANANNDQRRMAYYAVGRHHRLTSGPRSGGNRRCYFTGKLIFGGGSPFYAGIVQQGLRTLVVFCLPSALGMPHNLPNHNVNNITGASHKRRASGNVSQSGNSTVTRHTTSLLQRSRRTLSSASGSIALSKSPSKLSSTINLDDMSLSIEGDIDPNWNMDKDYLLSVLPDPSESLLAEMNQRYPEQFETLPVQVRHAYCWRLFVKFCFFSGLPIAEGELHYQVLPKLALELYGEDIVLSHDVMEAVNGISSAEILKLPNMKTFRYLKKHYQQQSAKLPEICFQRTSWEQVKAEV